jgi:excinuclease ABC subunit C
MLDLALKNLNLYVSKNKYSLVAGALQEKLGLSRLPVRIEGFDISHFAERERVGAAVTFLNGRPDKKNYRNYLIRTAGPGDPAALQEMLERRFKKGETRPDLLVIDGGQPQLGVALAVRESLEIDVDVVALAKGEERVYLADGRSLVLAEGSAERFLLQNVRDEVHRRAVTHHRKRREQV